MKLRFTLLLLSLIMLSAIACGGTSSDGGQPEQSNDTNDQKNLKIFVTNETHTGDFAGDSNLSGSNGMRRADDFCNSASNKPDNSNYKALLVDGLNRVAIPQTDWVLKASTTYYREDGKTIIGTTTSNAVFDSFVFGTPLSNLDNPISASACPNVWTGVQNVDDLSTIDDHCNQWASASTDFMGSIGECNSSTRAFSASVSGSCNFQLSIYCVEQP